ncbi:hypothetical protein AAHA92_20039 [Salvia divinorum]|uniref:Uncharacterized protein n=1 Tax=Salvia divinorum TaxID=28513 RepID=A0ABD1GH13_SALDI
MVSRNVLMALFLVTILLISSRVGDARELSEKSNRVSSNEAEQIDDDQYDCGVPGCCGIDRDRFCRCCR